MADETRSHARGDLPGPAADNIRAILEIEQRELRDAGWADRIGQGVTRFAGSIPFVALHFLGFVSWAAWNAAAPAALRFDPYPYSLLTFIVSLEGVLVATFVLIAQNRMAQQSNARDHLDLQINLLAEQEMTAVLRLLRRVCERLDIDCSEDEGLAKQTDVRQLMKNAAGRIAGPARRRLTFRYPCLRANLSSPNL